MFATTFSSDSDILNSNSNIPPLSSTTRELSAAERVPKTNIAAQDELIAIMLTRFEKLVERGFLAPHFLQKMVSDPLEVLKFLRQNRAVVHDQLNRRLDPRVRPSPLDLEYKGIIPSGYWEYGHEIAINHRHRRVSTAHEDLEKQIQLRSRPEQLLMRGVIDRQSIADIYDLDDDILDDDILTHDTVDVTHAHVNHNNNKTQNTWEISILNSLLFLTIQEALKKSCIDTQRQEHDVLSEMEEMNNEMKKLRDTLDKYFLSPHPVVDFEKDEQMVREKFHTIQEKLLKISGKQNRIHDKLRILHNVEKSMIDLQNTYDQNMNTLLKRETLMLSELHSQRTMRSRAQRIMFAERSHQNWAMAKLDFTIHVGKDHNLKIGKQLESGKQSITSPAELKKDIQFVEELEKFLLTLKSVSTHQQQIVLDYDNLIHNLDGQITAIRHEKSNVRRMVFKKIYELHKQVQIAESLELGNRRLSVGSAHEIDRERRHHSTKIQRQIDTLQSQVQSFNCDYHHQQLREILDVEIVMSDSKMKSFFSVFVQTFCQTIVDVELTWRNLNCKLPPDPTSATLCSQLYGTQMLDNIQNTTNTELYSKLSCITKFVLSIKRAILYEQKKQEKIHRKRARLLKERNIPRPNLSKNNRQYLKKADHSNVISYQYNTELKEEEVEYEAEDDEEDEEDTDSSNNSDDDIIEDADSFDIAMVDQVSTHRMLTVAIMIARKLCVNSIMVEDIERTADQQIPRLAEIRAKDIFEAVVNKQKIFTHKPLSILDVSTSILRNVFGICRISNQYYNY